MALLSIVDAIGAEALRAGEIIRRLRDLVRKESGRQVRADLNHLVRESVRLIEPEARARSVDLHLELSPSLPAVSCNDIQIEQVHAQPAAERRRGDRGRGERPPRWSRCARR